MAGAIGPHYALPTVAGQLLKPCGASSGQQGRTLRHRVAALRSSALVAGVQGAPAAKERGPPAQARCGPATAPRTSAAPRLDTPTAAAPARPSPRPTRRRRLPPRECCLQAASAQRRRQQPRPAEAQRLRARRSVQAARGAAQLVQRCRAGAPPARRLTRPCLLLCPAPRQRRRRRPLCDASMHERQRVFARLETANNVPQALGAERERGSAVKLAQQLRDAVRRHAAGVWRRLRSERHKAAAPAACSVVQRRELCLHPEEQSSAAACARVLLEAHPSALNCRSHAVSIQYEALRRRLLARRGLRGRAALLEARVHLRRACFLSGALLPQPLQLAPCRRSMTSP